MSEAIRAQAAIDVGYQKAVIQALEATGQYRVLRRLTGLPRTGSSSRPTATIVIVDTETTGLDPKVDKVIDIGLVKIEVDAQTGEFIRIIDTWESLEDPKEPIDAFITGLTGIDDSMVKGRAFNEAELASLMKNVSLVVAHGSIHDRRFLEKRFPWFENFPFGCSLDQVNWSKEGFGSAKLEFLAFRCGFFYDAHRALVDSHALSRILVDCQLQSTNQSVLKTLIQKCAESDYRLFANGAPFESKDLLRERGFRWDGEKKLWHITLEGDATLRDEMEWLKEHIYTRATRVEVEIIDSYVKYSGRPGIKEWRSIGFHGDSIRVASDGFHGVSSGNRQRMLP